METIELGAIVCHVQRSARKTIAMRPRPDGTAEILAPKHVSREELLRLAAPYADKLAADCAACKRRSEQRTAFTLNYGDHVRLLGGSRELRRGSAGRASYDEEAFYIPPGHDLRAASIILYKQAAREYIPPRVAFFAGRMELAPMSVKINAARSHWASCSARDTLNFAWYTIMASLEMVDYVVVHELCHMREFNHSARFWALVEAYCPNYRQLREKLKELGREIALENWY